MNSYVYDGKEAVLDEKGQIMLCLVCADEMSGKHLKRPCNAG